MPCMCLFSGACKRMIHCAAADLDEWEDVDVKQPPNSTLTDDAGRQDGKAHADEDEWEDV